MTDPAASAKTGAGPVLGPCHARSYEQWTLPARPILASVGGSCADDHISSGANGNKIDLFACNGTRGQDWSFRPDGTIRAGLYGGKCVTARGKPGAAGAKIELYTCSAATKGQKWTVSRTGGLSSELAAGGVCLALPSLTAANATPLVTARCTASSPRVHWHIW